MGEVFFLYISSGLYSAKKHTVHRAVVKIINIRDLSRDDYILLILIIKVNAMRQLSIIHIYLKFMTGKKICSKNI